jgi:hypothetical protein
VAFPPQFAEKQYFYVNYTRTNGGPSVVARFFVSAGDPDVAEAGSEERLLTVRSRFRTTTGGRWRSVRWTVISTSRWATGVRATIR